MMVVTVSDSGSSFSGSLIDPLLPLSQFLHATLTMLRNAIRLRLLLLLFVERLKIFLAKLKWIYHPLFCWGFLLLWLGYFSGLCVGLRFCLEALFRC